jgi:CBS domain-containing protein
MNGNLNAGDICSRIVTIADRRMTMTKAAQLMREHHVGCLVVVDDAPAGRQVAGLITDRDIVTSVVAMELDPAVVRVEDAMISDVVTATETESVTDLLRTMRSKGLRRLPVTTPQGVLVGLVTLDDLIEVLAGQLQVLAWAIDAEQSRERKQRR